MCPGYPTAYVASYLVDCPELKRTGLHGDSGRNPVGMAHGGDDWAYMQREVG